MEAVYCDKCEKVFRKDNTKHVTIKGLYPNEFEFDFCRECADDFEGYLYTTKVEGKEDGEK